MTVVTVFDDAQRILTMEGSPTITHAGIPTGGGGAAETVTFFQGAQSTSRKVTGSVDTGFYTSGGVPVDFIGSPEGSANKVVMFKVYISDFQDLLPLGDGVGGSTDEVVDGGLVVRIGSSTTDYGAYFIHDDGTLPAHNGESLGGAYPVSRSWLIIPINPIPQIPLLTKDDEIPTGILPGSPQDLSTPFVASGGTPDFSAVDTWGITAALSAGAAKAVNLFIDAIDVSDGLFITGGDGTDDDATFQDFADYDEGDINVRLGHVITLDGIFYVAGKLIIGRTSVSASPSGTAQATVFTDSGSVLVFPGAQVQPDWHEIEIDLNDSDTDVVLTDVVMRGLAGKPDPVWYHGNVDDDSQEYGRGDIDGVASAFVNLRDQVNRFNIGDWIQNYDYIAGWVGMTTGFGAGPSGDNLKYAYDEGAGFESPELPEQYRFYNDDAFGGCREGSSASNFGPRVSTGAGYSDGMGNEYFLIKNVDQRPNLTVTETASPAGSFTATGCVYDNFNRVVASLNSIFTSCKFIAPFKVTQNGATFDGCEFSDGQNIRGGATVIADDLDEIKNCTFTARTYLDIYFNGSSSPTVISPRFERTTVEGHAIEITVAGTYTFDGNVFNGYDADNEILVNIETDFTSSTASPQRLQGSVNHTDHGLTSGDPIMYTRNGGSGRVEGPGSPTGIAEQAVYYADVIDADSFNVCISPGIAVTRASDPDSRKHIRLISPGDSPEEIHAFYPPGAAILNSSGGLVTINVVNGAAPSVANINGSTTVVNTNVAVTITNLEPGSEVRIYPSSSESPLDLTEIDGIESTSSPSEFTFTAAAGLFVDIVIFHVDFVLPPDNRIRNFEVPNSATSFPVTQIPDRNFSNP